MKSKDVHMRKIAIILATMLISTLSAMTSEVGSIRGFMYGIEPNCGYDNWVSHVAEANPVTNNKYAPWDIQSTGFGSYRYPSDDDLLQWGELMQAWLSEDFCLVDSLISQYELPYELIDFQDTDVGRQYYMLRELLNDDIDYNGSSQAAIIEEGSFDYGWGLYIFNPAASRQMIVTAVHPCDDYPSPIIALEAMLKWDARFLFVAGAGREVMMMGMVNDSSLSDPSRHGTHVFNVAYQLACQQIRDLTGKIEFSVQMHTFDWQTHPTLKPVSVSAGQGRNYPSLPIVDNSRLRNDLFHHTPWEVLAENALGIHPAITIEDYYVVNALEPIACEASGQAALISPSRELPGSSTNQQMLYTVQPNVYDSYSPFFHVEMAELPIFLPQDELTWHKFYGWDEIEERWKMSRRWTLFIQCYTPWLDAMDATLDDLIRMDDFNSPSNPENFHVANISRQNLRLEWDRSYDYDFESYEIHIQYESDGEQIQAIIDRNDVALLARQSHTSTNISFGSYGSPMHITLRARDKNDRYSQHTEELIVYQPNPLLGSFQNVSISPQPGNIMLSFQAQFQDAVHYLISRSVNGGTYIAHSILSVNSSTNYQYVDSELQAEAIYRYRIGVLLGSGAEYWHYQNLAAQVLKPITIFLHNPQQALEDQLSIGCNYFAQDELDPLDIPKHAPPQQGAYVWLAAALEDDIHLSRDLKASFDALNQYKTWSLETRSSHTFANLTLSSDIIQNEVEGGLLLWDEAEDRWHDLRLSNYSWNNGNEDSRNFKLFWGFRKAEIIFDDLPRQIAEAGTQIELNWQVINASQLEHLKLWMHSPSDSLLIDPLVSPLQQSYTWQSPQSALCGYRLLIKAWDQEENLQRFLSPYLYDLIPTTVNIPIPAGFSSLSVPVASWTANLSTDFAPGTNVWKLSPNQAWTLAYSLQAFEAYVIDSPVATSLSYQGSSLIPNFSKNLLHGWNLIPNAHFHRYDLSQIGFNIEGNHYSYSELADLQLVSRKPYCITSRGWELVDSLEPNSTLLLYYFGSAQCTLILDPEKLSTPLQTSNPWELTLSFYSGEKGRDSIQIGSHELGSDVLNLGIDAQKPSRFNNQSLQSFIYGPNKELLQSKLKGIYADYQYASKSWNLGIVKTLNYPLIIEADCSKLPPDYRAKLYIADHSYTLADSEPIQIELPNGSFSATIVVTRSAIVSNQDEYLMDMKVFPNPFQDAITISWDDLKSSTKPKATVYNIKGQKVSSLDIQEYFGKYKATWDGRDQNKQKTAKGLYLIKIESSGKQMMRKVIKK